MVNLWRIASCSSAPWLKAEDADPSESSSDPPDVKVRSFDQHEEGVYDVAWSVADAWIYASLSCDGRYPQSLIVIIRIIYDILIP